jgi:hypothetical protein
MSARARCVNCRHYSGGLGWCSTARKRAGGAYRRTCASFSPWPIRVRAHGFVIKGDPTPVRLHDGRRWVEVRRPCFTAALNRGGTRH